MLALSRLLEETNQLVNENGEYLTSENAGGGDFVELFINAGCDIMISLAKTYDKTYAKLMISLAKTFVFLF